MPSSCEPADKLEFPLCFPFGVIFDTEDLHADEEIESVILKKCQAQLDQVLIEPRKSQDIERCKRSKSGRYISAKLERTVTSKEEIENGYNSLKKLSDDAQLPPIIQIL